MLNFIQQQGTLYLVGFSFVFMVMVWSLNRLQGSMPSPVNKLIVRWIRLIWIAVFVAIILKLTFLTGVPYWRLFSMGVLGWFLIDSGYLWLYILAWDRSELPLFPTVREVEKTDWPANRRFFLIKDWIRENNYRELGSFKYFYEDEVLQNMIVYESPDGMIRLQVIIVIDTTGVILDQVVFNSMTAEGDVIVTDNIFMPYGGFYPETWTVNRFPSVRKIEIIAKRHLDILASKSDSCCVKFEEEAKTWIDRSQKVLEEVNVAAGILNERRDREEFGKMTGEGRYRIWKELLLLNYFSVSTINR